MTNLCIARGGNIKALGIVFLVVFLSSAYPAKANDGWVSDNYVAGERQRLAYEKLAYINTLQQRISRIGHRILVRLNLPTSAIKFYVVEGEEIGAWSKQSFIWTTTAMMRFVQSDDELAAVLSHEFAHIVLGHGVRHAVAIQEAKQLAVSLIRANPWLEPQVAIALAEAALARFGRDQEREADVYGMAYTFLAGYKPESWPTLWERMAVQLPQGLTANLFSTHPAFPERLVIARQVARNLRAGTSATRRGPKNK